MLCQTAPRATGGPSNGRKVRATGEARRLLEATGMWPTLWLRCATVALGSAAVLAGCGETSHSGAPASAGGESGSPPSGGLPTGGQSTGAQATGGEAAMGTTGGGGNGVSWAECGPAGATSVVRAGYIDSSAPMGGSPETYGGATIVHRSTRAELLLVAESTETSDLAAPPYRFRLSGSELPLFPAGARVYLTKEPAGNPAPVPLYQKRPGYAWSLRDREAGTLLMGSSVDSPTSVAAPLHARIEADICSTPNSWCEGSDSAIIRQSVELSADSSVVLDSGESRIVAIKGNDYRVQVLAHRATAASEPGSCRPDYFPQNDTLLLVNAFAADLESRIQDLDRSELPDCIHGNDPPADVGFSLYEVPISTIYEGPVFFRSFEPSNYGEILFDVPALAASGSVPASLGIVAPPETFDPPAAGTEYWAEYSLDVATLREAQRGPIVFASTFSLVPFSESIESQLSLALGIGVFAERHCDYASGSETVALWDLVFDTDPPTRVRSGEINDLTYDGHDYSVWFWSEGIVHFSIFRRSPP